MSNSPDELFRSPMRSLLHHFLRSGKLRRSDQSDRNSIIDQCGHDPVNPGRKRFTVVTLWPQIMCFVKNDHQIASLQHILNPISQLLSFKTQVVADPQAASDGPIKTNVVVGGWNLNVPDLTRMEFTPGFCRKGFAFPGQTFNQDKTPPLQCII